MVRAYKENSQLINYHLTNSQLIFSNLLMYVSIKQEFSKNFQKVKGNSSSFGFAIEELPSGEAI